MKATQLLRIASKGNMSRGNREGINLFLKQHGYRWHKEQREAKAASLLAGAIISAMEGIDGLTKLEPESIDMWILRAPDGREIPDPKDALRELIAKGF